MNTYGYIYRPDYTGRGYTRDRVRLTGYYNLERRIDELRHRLPKKELDVFVSHKSEDKDTAEEVAETIADCGLTVYLDIWDPNVDVDGPELVDHIQSVIGCCNSLIAVVSHNTVRSWWVPLEIGIAITKELHLGTFLVPSPDYTKRDFPSYLWNWPVLKDTDKLEDWCRERQYEDSPQLFYESLKRQYPSMFQR